MKMPEMLKNVENPEKKKIPVTAHPQPPRGFVYI
jgi:hypothetical protein